MARVAEKVGEGLREALATPREGRVVFEGDGAIEAETDDDEIARRREARL